MLNTLKLVYGAVAGGNAPVLALSHFHIYKGRIQGVDGRMAIDAPLPELPGHELTIPADKLLAAINTGDGDKPPKFSVTDKNVTITDGNFKARIPILPNNDFPRVKPDPKTAEIKKQKVGSFLATLRILRPYIASDSSRAWSIGVWVDPKRAYATNNTIIIRTSCELFKGTKYTINLPVYLIDELLRIGTEPIAYGLREDRQSITFYYDDFWIQALTLSSEWPTATIDKLFAGFEKERKSSMLLPQGFKAALDRILPFCPDEKFRVICFDEKGISTEDGVQSARVDGFKLPKLKYNGDMLELALRSAQSIIFPDDPMKPTKFYMGDTEGLLAGLKA